MAQSSGIRTEYDEKRIKALLIIGLIGGCLNFTGDWLLGYGVFDDRLSGLERKLSLFLSLSDTTMFWSAFLGLIGIALEGLCYSGIYRLIAAKSERHSRIFRIGATGFILFAACGVHVPCLSTVYFYKHIMQASPDTAYDLTVRFGLYFLLPAVILFFIFFAVMNAAQISAFAKGLTSYPAWCWIFSVPVGMAVSRLLTSAVNSPVTNALATAWISIGNIWMFGGLLAMLCMKNKRGTL